MIQKEHISQIAEKEIELENLDLRFTDQFQSDSLNQKQSDSQGSPLFLLKNLEKHDEIDEQLQLNIEQEDQLSQIGKQNKKFTENKNIDLDGENDERQYEDLLSFDQDKEQEEKPQILKKDTNKLQQSDQVLLKRKLSRISLLVLLEIFIVGMIIGFYYQIGFERGQIRFLENDNITLNIKSCVLKINDYSSNLISEQDINFYSNSPIPSEINENILLTYSLPNLNIMDYQTNVEYEESDEGKILTIENPIDFQQCQINVFVYKSTALSSFKVECYREDCFIIMNSRQLEIQDLNVQGYSVDFTSQYLKTNQLRIESYFGYIELNDVYFNNSYLDISTGDISIQSTKSIEAELEIVNKLYCLTSYFDQLMYTNILDIKPNCIPVYPFRSEDKSAQNIVAFRCYKGQAIIKSSEKSGVSADSNKYKSFDQNIYGNEGNNVNLSVLSKQELENAIEDASDPKVYDPVFLIVFGSKYTQSTTFTQWQMTYNPAYSYLKPWWLGTLSYTLLSTQFYQLDITLAPGFCPYVPSLTKDRLISTQQVLENMFINEGSKRRKLLTLSWLSKVKLPPLKFSVDQTYDGKRDISIESNYSEDWIFFQKDKDSTIFENSLELQENVLAIILGLLFMIGIVYTINTNYLYLLDFIKHVDTYSVISKKNINLNDEDKEKNINEGQEQYEEYEEQINFDQAVQQEQFIKSIVNKDASNFKYTISGICNLFSTLVYLSPPLSAYIDQIALLLHKSRTNSINSFYSLLFQKINTNEETNDESIHNLEQDSITGRELKLLYEQYCYVNRLLEQKLDDNYSLKLLKQKGFKIFEKQDQIIQYYTHIKFNGIKTMILNKQQSSLELFMKSCCKLTKFDCDSIDSYTFESHYKEFCEQNHLDADYFNEQKLKKDYGIETKQLPQLIVERDAALAKSLKKKHIINKNRVKINFKIILSKEQIQPISENENYQELNDSIIQIYSPKGWFIYDFLAVIAHLSIIFLIGSPAIILIIFIRSQQYRYTLIPFQKYISGDDILFNFSAIPIKLMKDNGLVQCMTIISLVFWALCTWDLIYYYCLMSFPQERYFQNYRKAQRLRKLVSRIMWVIVLLAIYFIVVYICLTITWLILSAIINPEAFLPYASSSATFVTLIGNKYRQFKEVSEMGFEKLLTYVRSLSQNQFQEILKKMDIIEKVEGVIPTDQIKSLVKEAANFNLLDTQFSEVIQNNLEIMVRDPSAVLQLGQQIQQVAQNPQQFASNLMQKCEEKVKEQMQNIFQECLPTMYQSLIQILYNLMLNQKSKIKEDLILFFKGFEKEIKNTKQLSNKSKNLKQKQIKILQGPLMQLIQDLQNICSYDETKKQLIRNICIIISIIIQYRKEDNQNFFKDNEKDEKGTEKKILEDESYNQQKKFENKILSHQHLFNQGDQQEQQDEDLEYKSIKQEKESDQQEDNNNQEIDKSIQEQNRSKVEHASFEIFLLSKYSFENDTKGLLNQILHALSNQCLIEKSEVLLYLSQIRDIFKLCSEISDSQGLINTLSVQEKLLDLFSQKIYKDNNEQQCNISDLLTLLTRCAFSCKQCLQLPQIKEQSLLCYDLQSAFEKQNLIINYNNNKINILNKQQSIKIQNEDKQDSLISFYLNWLQGSFFDLPTENIKDLIDDLSKEFCEYKHIKELIFVNSFNNAKKGLSSLSKNIKKFQQFFNFVDILLGNPLDTIKLIKSSCKSYYGEEINYYLQVIDFLKIKYNNLTNYFELKDLYKNKILLRFATLFRIDEADIMGIILFIMNRIQDQEIIYFLKRIFKKNQIPERRIDLFRYLYGIFSAENEEEINICLNFLNFSQLRLIKFNQLTRKYSKITQEDFTLVFLYLQGHYSNTFQSVQRVLSAFENIFGKIITFEQLQKTEYIKTLIGELQISSQLIELRQIKNNKQQYQQIQKTIQQGFQALLLQEREGRISVLTLSKILKLLTFNKQGSSWQDLKYHELQIFSKIISLKNLKLYYQDVQPLILKESIADIAQAINVDENIFLQFFSLISSNSQQLYQKVLQLFEINTPKQSVMECINLCLDFNKQLEQKWNFIQEIWTNFFDQKIPLKFLRELLLFNNLPSDTETMFFILNTFNKQNSPLVKAFINYKYGIQSFPQEQLNFLLQEKLGQFELENNQGFYTLLQMFSFNTDLKKQQQLFLQYLYDSNKTILLLFSSLINFLSTKAEGIEIQVNNNNSKQINSPKKISITIIQYLSRKFDIKSEFFESFHQFQPNLPDLSFSIRQLIKYYRQADYQIQKLDQLNNKFVQNQTFIGNNNSNQHTDKNYKINQKQEQNNNLKYLSYNIINRVTISEQEVHQFYLMMTRKDYSPSFMSRIFQIPSDVAEFILTLNTSKFKKVNIDELFENAAFKRVLSKIGIQPDELATFAKFYYGTINKKSEETLQKQFKTSDGFAISCYQNLLQLRFKGNQSDSSLYLRKQILNMLKSNKLVKDMRVNLEYLMLLYCFNGYFLVLNTFTSDEIPLLQKCSKQSISIQNALLGSLSYFSLKETTTELNQKIFKKLSQKNNLRGQFKENLQINQENKEKQTIISKTCRYDHKMYLLSKHLYFSPQMFYLFKGVYNCQYKLFQRYYQLRKYDKQKDDISPLMLLIIVLKFKECPVLLKELLIQNQLAIKAPQIYSKDEQNQSEILLGLSEQKEKLIQQQNKILAQIFRKKINNVSELIKEFHYLPSYLYVTAYTLYYHSNVKFDFKYSLKYIEQILQECIKEERIYETFNDYINQSDSVGKKSLYEFIIQIFQKLNNDHCDFSDKTQPQFDDNYFPHKRVKEYFGCDPILQIVLTSTISNLSFSYFGYHGVSQRSQDHYKLISYEIDMLLSTIEQFYFFVEGFSELSKFKLFYLFVKYLLNEFHLFILFILFQGLACGFTFQLQDILNCLPYQTIFDKNYIEAFKNVQNDHLFACQKQYFEQKILRSLLFTIKCRESSTIDIKFSQNYPNYFRIIISKMYKEITSLKLLPQRVYLNIIENYEEYIQQYFLISSQFHSINKDIQGRGRVTFLPKIELSLKFNKQRNYNKNQFSSKQFFNENIHHQIQLNYNKFNRKIYLHYQIFHQYFIQNSPYFEEKKYNNIYELFLNQEQIFECQKQIQEEKRMQQIIQSENFQFFIDIIRSNYDTIYTNQYLNSKNLKVINKFKSYKTENQQIFQIFEYFNYYIYNKGFKCFSRSTLFGQKSIKNYFKDVEVYIQSCQRLSINFVSNKKSLLQLASLYFNPLDYNLTCLSDLLQNKYSTVNNVINLILADGLGNYDQAIENLVSETPYNDPNKWVLKNFCSFILYNRSRMLELTKYSNSFKQTSNQCFIDLYKFVWGITISYWYDPPKGATGINLLDNQTNVSEVVIPDNKLFQNQMLFRICNSIIYSNGKEIDPYIKDINSNQLKEQYQLLAKILRDISENNWKFLNDLRSNQLLREQFCDLFHLNDQQYTLIEYLSILKPEISKLHQDKNKQDKILSQENVFQKIKHQYQFNQFLITKRKNYIRNLVNIGFNLREDEQKQLELLMLISNQSLSSLVEALNEFYYNKNIDLKGQMNQSGITPDELIVFLQSVLLTKFSTKINWSSLHQKIKKQNGQTNKMDNEQYYNSMQQIISSVFNSFDIISNIFLNNLQNKNQTDFNSEIITSSHKSSQQVTKLIDFKNLNQYQPFNLSTYQSLESGQDKQNDQRSLFMFKYLIKLYQQIISQYQSISNLSNRFILPSNQEESNNQQSQNRYFDRSTCQQITSIIFGAPFLVKSKQQMLMKLMLKSSKLFTRFNVNTYFHENFTELSQDNISLSLSINSLIERVMKLYFISFYSNELSLKYKNKIQQFEYDCLKDIATISLNEKWMLCKPISFRSKLKENQFANQIIQAYLGENIEKKLNSISEEFSQFLVKNITDIESYIGLKKMPEIFEKLNQILERSIISINDSNIIDEIIQLLKSIDQIYIDQDLVKYIIKLMTDNDYNSLMNIVKFSQLIQEEEFDFIIQSIDKMSQFSIFNNRRELNSIQQTSQQVGGNQDQMKDVAKRIEQGNVSVQDIFKSIDSQGDGNGLISLTEFYHFLRRTGISMSEHRTNELFATIKKNRNLGNDNIDDTELNQEEFEETYNYIIKKKTDMSLEKLGISPALLALSLGTVIIILILLLVFIFLGIKAFALGGTFGSIINSIIPVAAMSGTASQQNNKEKSLKEEHLKEVVKETSQILQSDNL